MGAIGTVYPGDMPAPVEDRRKKKRYAYPACMCLGSHYLYLGRPFTQLLFWLTLGGLLLWWIADFFRLPSLVEEHNRRAAEKLGVPDGESLDERLARLEALSLGAWDPAPPPAAAFHGPVPDLAETAPAPASRSLVPAFVLTSAVGAAVALYIFNPPPLFPHADASFRAVRQVNVRDLPSTASPIRGVVAKEAVLSGTVEAASGGAAWLKIGRGSHSGGYVAVQNLESL